MVLLLLTMVSWQVAAQVRFDAYATNPRVSLDDYVEVNFALSGGRTSRIEPPNFAGFRVVGTQTSSSFVMSNGAMSQKMIYTYQLKPLKAGKFTIGAATTSVSGKTYSTQPITVEVLKGRVGSSTSPQGGGSRVNTLSADQLDKEVFLVAEVDTSNVFVGKEIIVSYRIYTALAVDRFYMTEEPEFEGFYKQELQAFANDTHQENVKGKPMVTKIIKRYALFPLKAGILDIPALKARAEMGIFTGNLTTLDLKTETHKLVVRELPRAGNEGFSGGIGVYQMTEGHSATSITTDDAFTMQLVVKGIGDVKRITAPAIDLPKEAFDIYDPKQEESSNEQNGLVVGTKAFDYQIVPRQIGQFTFTPKFVYFDTDSAKYVTLTSAPITLNITKGKNPIKDREQTNTITDLKKMAIRPNRTNVQVYKPEDRFWGSPIFIVLLAVPLLGIGGALFIKRKQEAIAAIDPNQRRSQLANKEALRRLSTAQQLLAKAEPKAFYQEISKVLWTYFSDKLHIPTAQLARQNIRQKLADAGVSDTQAAQALDILDTCDYALFAASPSPADMKRVYEQTSQLIGSIDNEIKTQL